MAWISVTTAVTKGCNLFVEEKPGNGILTAWQQSSTGQDDPNHGA